MRLVFAGTPEFAVPPLEALHAAGHEIAAVYTQPDRPSGRGRQLKATPVALRAAALGLPVRKAERLDTAELAALRAVAPDALVVVAYGLILPAAALAIPRHGGFNIHASLLPRWRGAAPIARAILAGDRETGISIMQMEAGLDTGPVALQERLPIGPAMTAGELHGALEKAGARLIVEAMAQLARGALRLTPQPAAGVTYARKLSKDEARLDWSLSAEELARRVRGYNPQPVAWSELDGERVRIFLARPADASPAAAPGTILAVEGDGLAVATGAGTLVITELQWPGGRALTGREAARGRSLTGRVFR